MKEIRLHQDLYDADVSFLLGGSVPEVNALVTARHGVQPEPLDDDTNGYQFHISAPLGKNEIFYVWIHTPDMNLLWHETMHCAFDILKTRGIIYTEDSEEAFAYLGADIFEMLCKKLKIKIK